jgi:hypothetical protein
MKQAEQMTYKMIFTSYILFHFTFDWLYIAKQLTDPCHDLTHSSI